MSNINYYGNRTTSEYIDELKENEIFVFGSNKSGIHGAGAAKKALEFGAFYGKFFGIQGNTFAIPTKDANIKTLPIEKIKSYVDDFILYAKKTMDRTFLVTPIGCGLAGYEAKDIAPLFKDAIGIINIHLPTSFWKTLEEDIDGN